jgi:DNA-binding transcriptional LysR family regulator
MIDEMNAIKNGHSGLIKIALSPGVRLHDNLVKIIMCFEKDYPDIHIDLQSHNMGELQNLLLNQQVDFVHSVVTDFSGIPFIASHFIGTSRNYLIVPKDHPAANKKIEDLSLCDFKDDTFLFYTDQIQAIKSFSRRCESFGFSLKYKTVSCASMMTLSFELRRGIMLSEETNMHKASADMVILPLPELGCIELGIMHNTKNKKECNATFINYIQIANANQGNYSSGGYLR